MANPLIPRPNAFISLLLATLAAPCAQAQPTWSTPPILEPREAHALTFDQARGRAVLFGGYSSGQYFNDTWLWDGTTWNLAGPMVRPPARSRHAMAYGPEGRVVLFGGGSSLSDTWKWDGANWSQAFPRNTPAGRYGHAMAYDAARNRVILFGGYGGGRLSDTWEWDGSNWSQRQPTVSPTARSSHAMVYDSARWRTLLFGGSDGSNRSDTWEYADGPPFVLAAATQGNGVGDLQVRISGYPGAATNVWLLASGTPSPGPIPGTGQFFGLFFPDTYLFIFMMMPPLPGFFVHFPAPPAGPDPYGQEPVVYGAGTFSALAGTLWDLTAIAYTHGTGIVGQTNFQRLRW